MKAVSKRAKKEDSTFRKPPLLKGYTYSPEEAYIARKDERLLTIRIETNTTCNLKCRYCYAESGGKDKKVADFDKLKRIIDQGADMGLRSVVIIGGGEPTLYPQFKEIISFIDSKGIIPVIFSNTLIVDKKMAEFLYAHNASVMGKLDSFDPDTQNFLTGRKGSYAKIQKGLSNLMAAGFTEPEDQDRLRLGVSFVSNRLNLSEIDKIWKFCRKNNVFPNMEILTPTGRAKENLSDFILNSEEIKDYKMRLLKKDRKKFMYDWLPYTPLTASGCLQHLYSLYITIHGDVRPCAPTKFDQHPDLKEKGVYPYNINRMSLKDIYDSKLFYYVRNIDKYLEGKCSGCRYLDQCIGCRGYAYSVGINNGLSPKKALRLECQQCFK